MPFCTACGTRVEPGASYCANCGSAQPGASKTQPAEDLLSGISDRIASILCYIPVLGVIPSIGFLASQKFRHNQRVRFDAFQSVYIFVAWLIVSSAGPLFLLGFPFHHNVLGMLKALLMVCWIFLLVKASNQEQVHLPILGDLAARSTSEQL